MNERKKPWWQNDLFDLSRIFGGQAASEGWTDPGSVPSQDKIDFSKEFTQSMLGGIGKPPKETSVGQLSIGGGQKRFQVNPLQAAPEVSQYAPTPGFSLVRPLKKKHWYDYGGTA